MLFSRSFYSNAVCSSCEHMIVGDQIICLACEPSYCDLCTNCGDRDIFIHKSSHVLLKVSQVLHTRQATGHLGGNCNSQITKCSEEYFAFSAEVRELSNFSPCHSSHPYFHPCGTLSRILLWQPHLLQFDNSCRRRGASTVTSTATQRPRGCSCGFARATA